jgi:transcriptional regulator with XRE-family HTH domain
MQNTNNNFAARLNHLFEEKRKPDGTRYARKEVLESAPMLTRVYLWRLQTGKVSKPSYGVVKALADFFGVDPSYFFEGNEIKGETTEEDQQEELQVLLRSFGLNWDEQKAVRLMIESLKNSKR